MNENTTTNNDDVTLEHPNSGDIKRAKAKFLKENLEKQIASFNKKRRANQKKAFALKVSATLFAVAITILLGLTVKNPIVKEYFSNTALILSGMITVLSAWDAFYNYKGLWVRYTFTICQLYSAKADLEYLMISDLNTVDITMIDQLYRKYQNILDETNESWRTLRKEETKQAQG